MTTSTATKMILITAATILLLPLGAVGDDINSAPPPLTDETSNDGWLDVGFEDSTNPEEEPVELDLDEEVDVAYFFDKMAPWGEWTWTNKHGWVWAPDNMPEDWRPFTYGHWVYSEAGWTWVSSFPWGWAAFHYGSWANIENIGWVWVPGGTWAPARVIWRYSTTYVGWSPIIAGYDYWLGWDFYPIYYSYWSFVAWTHFHHVHIHHYYLTPVQISHVFHHTHFPGHCGGGSGPLCHRGPNASKVSKLTGRKLKRQRVMNTAIPAHQLKRMAKVQSNHGKKKPGLVNRNDRGKSATRIPTWAEGSNSRRKISKHRAQKSVSLGRSQNARGEIRTPRPKPTPGTTIKPRSPSHSRYKRVSTRNNRVVTRSKQSSQRTVRRSSSSGRSKSYSSPSKPKSYSSGPSNRSPKTKISSPRKSNSSSSSSRSGKSKSRSSSSRSNKKSRR